jgi:hypothetical protein
VVAAKWSGNGAVRIEQVAFRMLDAQAPRVEVASSG